MKRLAFLALAAVAFAPQDGPKPDRLVVHEWGTFTSVAGVDGAALEWRPLAGPSDLPSFVYELGGTPKGLRNGNICGCGTCTSLNPDDGKKCETCGHFGCRCKGCSKATVRMETPVLYFYADRETDVAVRVDFPKGKVTEWYPQAREVGSGIDWGRVRVMPGGAERYCVEEIESHYWPARETDAAPVRVCGKDKSETEKFLFYRGVGTFDLPLRATVDESGVAIGLAGALAVPDAILFENLGGRIGWTRLGPVDRARTAPRPLADRNDLEPLLDEIRGLLVAQGLYEREAAAMVKTWRDSWFEEGARIIYIVPAKDTERILPLALDPAPTELVRVLVGRMELITPEREAAVLRVVERLGDPSPEVREKASAELRALGRFAEPTLRTALPGVKDREIAARIQAILDRGAAFR